MKYKKGDAVYFLRSEDDGEVDCYIVECLESSGMYKLKLHDSRSYVCKREDQLTQFHPNWESLEENLAKDEK